MSREKSEGLHMWFKYNVRLWAIVMTISMILSGCVGESHTTGDIEGVVPTLTPFSGSVDENAAIGTVVGRVNVVDSGDSTITAFTLSDTTNFRIDASGQIMTNAVLDYETRSSYSMTVTATNTAGISAPVSVDIAVNNVPDVVPILSDTNLSIMENSEAGSVVGYITIEDEGDSPITAFQLTGEGEGNFTVGTDGKVYVASGATLDYETQAIYHLMAVADNDAGSSTAVHVDITIMDYTDPFIIAKIQARDKEEIDYFGYSVSVSGDKIVVGAYSEDAGGLLDAGAAYVYQIESDGSVTELAKIEASDAEAYDNFGISVAISGDKIVVGAYREDAEGVSNAGAAYLYQIEADGSVTEFAKIEASDAEVDDYFGYSVAISGDKIIVGAYGEDEGGSKAGAAYVYQIETNGSVSELAKIEASDAEAYDNFGNSVAISGDKIIVGAYGEDEGGSKAGAAYVYQVETNGSVSELAKIEASDAETDDYFGKSVAISGDKIIVGAYGEDTGGSSAGAAYVYQVETDGSVTEIKKIQAIDQEEEDWFGRSVAIDGDKIIVGAYREDTGGTDAGAAYVIDLEPVDRPYVYNIPQGTILYAEEYRAYIAYHFIAASPSDSAISFTLSGIDGDAFRISGSDLYFDPKADYEVPNDSDDNNEYNLTIIVEDTSEHSIRFDMGFIVYDQYYLEAQEIYAGDIQANQSFGKSVAIDGDKMVAGAPYEDTEGTNAGAAYVYQVESNGSMIQLTKIQASDAEAYDNFGYSVAISGDKIIVGTPYKDTGETGAGAAYLYEIGDDGSVTELAKIEASDAEKYDYFGYSVAISGDKIIVGAYGEDTGGSSAGAAYVYQIESNGSVTELAKIEASDAEEYDNFGYSVAISGDKIIVGAYGEDTGGDVAGAAYVYQIESNGSVTELAKIEASDAEKYDYFGYSVAISGDKIIVGAYGEDTGGSSAGAAYMYQIESNGLVTELAKIEASDAEEYDNFGYSVAISGDKIIVGARSKDNAIGAVYPYQIETDGSVSELVKIQARDKTEGDYFGSSVSISGDNVIVGALYKDLDVDNPTVGTVYWFVKDSDQP